MRAIHFWTPRGDMGTHAVLAKMAQLVRAGMVHPLVRATAVDIVSPLYTRDGESQSSAIRGWLDEHTSFLRDPDGHELLHTPDLMLRRILTKGEAFIDCDDVAVLAATLGKAVGLPARFVVVGFRSPQAPYRHVWTELADPRKKRWVEMDVTRPVQALPDAISRVFTMRV